MKVTMLRLLSLILICSYAIGADLPQDAQSLVNAEAMKEAATKAKFDADIAALRKELLPKLQKAQEAATKKGDLDGAVAIKAKLAELAPTKEDKPAPADPTLIVGLWQLSMKGSNYKSLWTFDKKGGVTNSEGNTGKYAIDGDKVTVTWDQGAIEHLTMPEKGARETAGVSVNGIALTFTKQ